jgi:hypothetical protein
MILPISAQKWQKYCINDLANFSAELPELPPFGCPKCDYSGANKTMLLLHYGITHKVVVR